MIIFTEKVGSPSFRNFMNVKSSFVKLKSFEELKKKIKESFLFLCDDNHI